MKLNKLMALMLIPCSMCVLASCDDGQGEITNDSKMKEWVEKDITTIAKFDDSFTLPYDETLFEAYKIVTPPSEEGQEEKISYDRNYSLEYDSDLAKLFLYYTTIDAGDAKKYADYCVSEGFIVDDSIAKVDENDFNVYSSTVDTDKVSNRTYLNIHYALGKMTVMAYKQISYFYSTWNTDLIRTHLGLKDDENLFPAPSASAKDFTFTKAKAYRLNYLEITVHSENANELKDYQEKLTTAGFKIDKAYDTDSRANYYLIPKDKNYALNVYLDKNMVNNSFTMRFDKDSGK